MINPIKGPIFESYSQSPSTLNKKRSFYPSPLLSEEISEDINSKNIQSNESQSYLFSKKKQETSINTRITVFSPFRKPLGILINYFLYKVFQKLSFSLKIEASKWNVLLLVRRWITHMKNLVFHSHNLSHLSEYHYNVFQEYYPEIIDNDDEKVSDSN